jgi:hypothetical protein
MTGMHTEADGTGNEEAGSHGTCINEKNREPIMYG